MTPLGELRTDRVALHRPPLSQCRCSPPGATPRRTGKSAARWRQWGVDADAVPRGVGTSRGGPRYGRAPRRWRSRQFRDGDPGHCSVSWTNNRCSATSTCSLMTTSAETPTRSWPGSRPARCPATVAGRVRRSTPFSAGSTPASPSSTTEGPDGDDFPARPVGLPPTQDPSRRKRATVLHQVGHGPSSGRRTTA